MQLFHYIKQKQCSYLNNFNKYEKKNKKSSLKHFSLILLFFTIAINLIPSYASEKITVPQEEVEMLKDYGNALKNTISETKSELENIKKKYTWVKDTFGNHKYPKILEIINKLDKNGLGKHLGNGIATLGKYEKGITKVTNVAADSKSIIAFYDNYRPDKNNPLRSLEQISHSLEELNRLIKKNDPSVGILTKPITSLIGFYQKSASAFHDALDRVKNRIKERSGWGIGTGFTAYTDKDKKFIKKFPGETIYRYPWIKYMKPGSYEEIAEFWDNQSNRAFVWKNNNWTEIKPGVSALTKVYHGMKLAFGERPDINTLITRCNIGWNKVVQAEKYGKIYFSLLHSGDPCISKILDYKNIKLDSFPEKEFIARYVFRNNSRKKINNTVEAVKNSVLVEGKVTGGKSGNEGLDNILISAKTSRAHVQTHSKAGGWFTLLFNINSSNNQRGNAQVKINAPGYIPYNTPWPLQHQCNNWYTIKLISVENANTPSNFSNANSVMEGYGKGLTIKGNAIVTSGEVSTYTACNSDGNAYPSSGSFSWLSSMENVLVVGKSGNTVSATGFKAGTSSIMLQHDGMMAYLNVKVRAKVPNVTSMTYRQAVDSIEEMNLKASVAGNHPQNGNIENLPVLSQAPTSGSIVDANHNIILRLGKGKKKNSIFSISGGEKVDKVNSLFSISGGEKVEKGNLPTEYDSSKNQKEKISSLGDGSGREMVEIQDPDELLGGAWTFHNIRLKWQNYVSPNWESDRKTKYKNLVENAVVVQFKKQGNMYIGKVIKQGYICYTFDAFGGRDHLLTVGKEVCWVMKTGKNIYEGEIFEFTVPCDKVGGKNSITIGVYGNAAKFLQIFSGKKRLGIVSNPDSEHYSSLMLRVPVPTKPGKKLKNKYNNNGGSIELLNQKAPKAKKSKN